MFNQSGASGHNSFPSLVSIQTLSTTSIFSKLPTTYSGTHEFQADNQIAKLREGLNAVINVDYDTDQFIVTAACEYWVDKYLEARKDSFPEEIPDMELVDHTRDICNKICGKYTSLEEINQMMEKYFVPGTWEVMA